MKTVLVRRTGGPGVFETAETPDPSLGDNDVLVDLKATGLNWSEVMIRRGEWPVELGGGFVLGAEGAGVVEKTGAAVDGLAPGDRVVVCDFSAYLEAGQGCYAEKIKVPGGKLLRFPRNLDFPEAAALPIALLTACDAMHTHSPLPESGTVVVTACTGAVGIAAIQLARRKNLRAIGVTRSEKKKKSIQALGAEVIVESDPARLKEKIVRMTGEKGIDYVFDPVCGETATALIELLNYNGTYVLYGVLAGNEFTVPSGLLFNQVRIHGYVILRNLADPEALQSAWRDALPLVETGEVVIPVHREFPLQQAADAHREMEAHEHWGKLVLVQ